MRVKLAVQILSNTVSTALKHLMSDEASETAMLCSMMNCGNVRSTTDHNWKNNDDVKPYQDPDDDRLLWLTEVFLPYFKSWKSSISKRTGNF